MNQKERNIKINFIMSFVDEPQMLFHEQKLDRMTAKDLNTEYKKVRGLFQQRLADRYSKEGKTHDDRALTRILEAYLDMHISYLMDMSFYAKGTVDDSVPRSKGTV